MKKFMVLLVVVALTLISSMAFAELAVNGSIDTRSWNVNNKDHNDQAADREAKTQTRVRLVVDGKAGDAAKARIQIENDWDTWGRLEGYQADTGTVGTSYPAGDTRNLGFLKLREAWVDVALPMGGLHLRGGHQLLQLGHGWFFRSMKYGSDAWVVYTDIGNLHLGFVDVKVSEGAQTATDDADAYVVVGSYKISDTMKAGVDITARHIRQAAADVNELINIGLNFTGKIGPVDLKAEIDKQMGDNGANRDYDGLQIVAQANIALDPVVINATLATGSGQDTSTDITQFQNHLDADGHYTICYEYLYGQPAGFGVGSHAGFANTLAMGAGASFKATPSLSLSADIWKLAAVEAPAGADDDLGMEVDLRVNWKLADNVTWNWAIGRHMVGDAYGANADDTDAIIGILSVKF